MAKKRKIKCDCGAFLLQICYINKRAGAAIRKIKAGAAICKHRKKNNQNRQFNRAYPARAASGAWHKNRQKS